MHKNESTKRRIKVHSIIDWRQLLFNTYTQAYLSLKINNAKKKKIIHQVTVAYDCLPPINKQRLIWLEYTPTFLFHQRRFFFKFLILGAFAHTDKTKQPIKYHASILSP